VRVIDLQPAEAAHGGDPGALGLWIIADLAAVARVVIAAMRSTEALHYGAMIRGAPGAAPGASGFLRSLGAAPPDPACRMIDLAPDAQPGKIAAPTRQSLPFGDGADPVALRGYTRHLARIAPDPRARLDDGAAVADDAPRVPRAGGRTG
jgi:hypothetical protein